MTDRAKLLAFHIWTLLIATWLKAEDTCQTHLNFQFWLHFMGINSPFNMTKFCALYNRTVFKTVNS